MSWWQTMMAVLLVGWTWKPPIRRVEERDPEWERLRAEAMKELDEL